MITHSQHKRQFGGRILIASQHEVLAAWRLHLQNATLAGGVSIGAVGDMAIGLHGAMFVGVAAGLVSVVGYVFIQPWLEGQPG